MSFPGSGSAGSRVLIVLGRAVGFVVGLLLCLPLLLLPYTTAVPTALAVVLIVLGVGLLIWQFRSPAIGLAGALACCILAVIFSQVFAATPAITDAAGKAVPGAIASLEKVSLNGSEQWITIRGQDASKPILLNLGMGGPGGGGFTTRTLFEPLEKDFVVVSWDEPGTGKSYNAIPISALTTERFIDDGHALTLYLRERFHQDKIYVYGVSWTSILGVWLVQRYPELYHAYIGNAQMVNTTQNDVMGYELALQYLTDKGDSKKAGELRGYGPPPYNGAGMLNKYVAFLDVLNEYMGSLPYTVAVPIVPFFAPEYGYVDKINHTRGLLDSFPAVYPHLRGLDFMKQAPKLEVPVYLFAGRKDVNAMSSLVESYYDMLSAPRKQLIWLEGGHGLEDSNAGQFVDVMVHQVLPQTYPAGSQ